MQVYEYKNKWLTINELSELSGIKADTIRDRLRRGYSIHEAVKVIPTNESVKEFSNASYWEDWIGRDNNYLYSIYWKWSVSNGYTPLSKQSFSRQLYRLYPNIKTVPTKRGERYSRVIRER